MTTHYLYWLRDETHTRIETEGYVGVTKNPKKRFTNHRHDCKRYERPWYPDEMIIIMSGSEYECLDMEYRLRPEYGIGWNKKPGGDPYLHWPDSVRRTQ